MKAFLNSERGYGVLSIALHWLTALTVVGLFLLGTWMVDLDYYSQWYKTGPDVHRSIGVLLVLVVLLRLVLRFLNPPPAALPAARPWENRAASVMHWLLLVLLLAIAAAGYLISTADGRAVSVFNWFDVPATVTSFENQEDWFGEVHFYLAVTLMCLAGIHAAAALKHHFFDRDDTLRRMFGN